MRGQLSLMIRERVGTIIGAREEGGCLMERHLQMMMMIDIRSHTEPHKI